MSEEDIRQGINLFEMQRLKQLLCDAEDKSYQYAAHGWNQWWKLAASVCLLLGLSYWMINQPEDAVAVADKYYQHYPNVINPATRSAHIRHRDDLSVAMQAYEAGDYHMAIRLLNAYATRPAYTFYLALCYYETGQQAEAIARFEQVKTQQSSGFYEANLWEAILWEAILWYQALAYLKTHQVQQAKSNLTLLTATNNPYQKKALALMQALD